MAYGSRRQRSICGTIDRAICGMVGQDAVWSRRVESVVGVPFVWATFRLVRRWSSAAAAVAACIALSGCTVPIAGGMGIGRDDQGRLVGYLQVCHDRIDGATLYYNEAASTGDANPASVDVGKWTAGQPVSGFSEWSMASAGTEWTTTVPLTSLQPSRRYTLYGWTKDNSWSAGEVSFTLEEISKLRPGQILYWAGQPGSDRNATTNSHTDFKTATCKNVE